MKIVFNEKKGTPLKIIFNESNNEVASDLKENNLLKDKLGSFYFHFCKKCGGSYFLNLKDGKYTEEDLRLFGSNIIKDATRKKIEELSIELNDLEEKKQKDITYLIEGFYHGLYVFDKYKKDKKEENITIYIENVSDSVIKNINEISNIMTGVNLTRDLVNLPAIDLYPESYKDIIIKEFENLPVEVEVFNKEQIKELNMKAGLAVSYGSDKEPYFVVLKYQPNKNKQNFLTLVGKGLTYDSGGYAIKPASGMTTMNCDMAGSATVIGAIKALALNKVRQNVYGVMFLTENMINGSSYKNGDIISSMKGSSIYVGNTDAEGRLTLADSIYYAATKLKSKAIVETSTLTGACVYALGDQIIGAVSNDNKLFKQVEKAGDSSGEQIHLFPTNQKMRDALKSKVADITNTPKQAGAITAGLFLEHFVEGKPFVHLDMAGPAYIDKYLYYPGGASGIGVRTFYNLAKKFK